MLNADIHLMMRECSNAFSNASSTLSNAEVAAVAAVAAVMDLAAAIIVAVAVLAVASVGEGSALRKCWY